MFYFLPLGHGNSSPTWKWVGAAQQGKEGRRGWKEHRAGNESHLCFLFISRTSFDFKRCLSIISYAACPHWYRSHLTYETNTVSFRVCTWASLEPLLVKETGFFFFGSSCHLGSMVVPASVSDSQWHWGAGEEGMDLFVTFGINL